MIWPLQLPPHGVAVEHVPVQLGGCPSTATVIPVLSQILAQARLVPHIMGPGYSLFILL